MLRVKDLGELSLKQIQLRGISAGTWLHECRILQVFESELSKPLQIPTPQYDHATLKFTRSSKFFRNISEMSHFGLIRGFSQSEPAQSRRMISTVRSQSEFVRNASRLYGTDGASGILQIRTVPSKPLLKIRFPSGVTSTVSIPSRCPE